MIQKDFVLLGITSLTLRYADREIIDHTLLDNRPDATLIRRDALSRLGLRQKNRLLKMKSGHWNHKNHLGAQHRIGVDEHRKCHCCRRVGDNDADQNDM